MSVLRTRYLRVTEGEIIPVEIQSASNSNPVFELLRDRHILEILQLLQGTIETFVEQKKNKQTTVKQQKDLSGIITGTSIRFGYSFKSRPNSQTCMVEETSESCCLRSFHVLKDKVVVYAQPLIPGSPARMSQLMKVLNGKRQSTGQGVSISSYFKKIPLKTVSQNVSSLPPKVQESSESSLDFPCQKSFEKDAKEKSSVADLSEAATSEGHRNKIKNILKRGEVGKSRKHKKRNHNLTAQQSEVVSDKGIKTIETLVNARICEQESESRSKEITNENTSEKEEIDLYDEKAVEITEICKSKTSELETMKQVSLTSYQREQCVEGSEKSFMLGDVQVSLINKAIPIVNKDCVEAIQGNTITLISKEQMNDIEREKSCIQSKEDLCLTNPSCSGDEMLHNQSDVQSSSSDEIMALPSASFIKTKETVQILNAADDLISYDADYDSDVVTDSPKFVRRTPEERTDDINSFCSAIGDLKGKRMVNHCNDNSSKQEDPSSTSTKHKTLHKQKIKRKYPTFSSDSDSDINIPVKKLKTNNEKFVTLENMKSNTRKTQISKSFFSMDDGKSQPTFSYFMSRSKKLSATKKSSDGASEAAEEDAVVIDDFDAPKVKNEVDTDLMNEIQKISSVGKLNEEQLQYLTRSNEKYLRGIFEGKVSCERHQEFKKGGKSRRDLNYSSRLCQYSEEQVDTVMECLIAMFCKRHHKYLDYIMKVLLPEMLIKVHMDVHGTGHAESEKIIASQPNSSQPN